MLQKTHSEFVTDDNGNPTGGKTTGIGIEINWQDGPLGNPPDMSKQNGAFIEGAIDACINRLKFFQDSKFSCRENALAITKLEEALLWLQKRMIDRQAQGVEGLHKVHQEA